MTLTCASEVYVDNTMHAGEKENDMNEIKFNGLYYGLDNDNDPIYLRFFPDGLVVHTDTNQEPSMIWSWLNREASEKGLYVRSGNGNQIDFIIKGDSYYNPDYALKYSGVVLENEIRLDRHNISLDRLVKDIRFVFISMA